MATVKGNTAPAEKMVTIHLFRDNRMYNDDVFVGVNGKTYLIKRGVDVEVPESVAEVIRNSQKQDSFAIREMDKLQQGGEW